MKFTGARLKQLFAVLLAQEYFLHSSGNNFNFQIDNELKEREQL